MPSLSGRRSFGKKLHELERNMKSILFLVLLYNLVIHQYPVIDFLFSGLYPTPSELLFFNFKIYLREREQEREKRRACTSWGVGQRERENLKQTSP